MINGETRTLEPLLNHACIECHHHPALIGTFPKHHTQENMFLFICSRMTENDVTF